MGTTVENLQTQANRAHKLAEWLSKSQVDEYRAIGLLLAQDLTEWGGGAVPGVHGETADSVGQAAALANPAAVAAVAAAAAGLAAIVAARFADFSKVFQTRKKAGKKDPPAPKKDRGPEGPWYNGLFRATTIAAGAGAGAGAAYGVTTAKAGTWGTLVMWGLGLWAASKFLGKGGS